jgi:aspartyl protease family protein
MRQILIFAVAVMLIGGFGARYADRAMNAARRRRAAGRAAARSRAGQLRPQPGALQRPARPFPRRGQDRRPPPRLHGRHRRFAGGAARKRRCHGRHPPAAGRFHRHRLHRQRQAKAAPAKLERIEIGDIIVFDVPALVLPDEALAQNLLGVSFLSRLRRYEYANGRLVLEQ